MKLQQRKRNGKICSKSNAEVSTNTPGRILLRKPVKRRG